MNDSTIFDKTAAGDEAIREKTRLVQRNLRLVLVLVNGIADVASLKRSLGDPAMVESALEELERLGLIESEEACARRLVQSERERVPAAVVEERPLIEAQTVFDEELAQQVQVRAAAVPPPVAKEPPKPKVSPLTAIPNWIEGLRSSRARAQEEALYERAYGSEHNSHEYADPVSIDPSMAPLPPERKPLVKLGTLIKGSLIALVVVLGSLALFYPYESHQPAAEARLSAMLGDGVRVGSLRVTFLPPSVVLDQVSVGMPPYAEARSIRLLPALGFLTGASDFRSVEVEGLRIREGMLAHTGRWFLPSAMVDASIGHIRFAGATLDLGGHVITGLSGEIRTADGVKQMIVHAADDKVEVTAVPKGEGVAIQATALNMQLPFQPNLDCTRIDVQGELMPGRLDLQKVEALLYDGSLVGKGNLTWSATSAGVSLTAKVDHLATGRFLGSLGGGRLVDGETALDVVVSGSAPLLAELDRTMRIDGDFKVTHGNLKLDLVEAVRSKAPVRGGQMRFETFAGSLASDASRVRLNNLRLTAGFLRAGGQVAFSRGNGALSGALRVDMRGGAAEGAGAALTLEGSTDNPVLRGSH
jgi:hypothetical protein